MTSDDSNAREGQNPNIFMDSMMNMQKQWMDSMKTMANSVSGPSSESGTAGNPLEFAQKWASDMQSMFQKGIAGTQQSAAAVAGWQQTVERLANASQAYSNLLELWKQIPGFQGAKGNTSWAEGAPVDFFGEVFKRLNINSMPGEASRDAWQKASTNVLGNWAQFMTEMAKRASQGISMAPNHGTETVRDFYASWLKLYESTIGRFVKMPTLGPARYDNEKLEKSIDSYIKYQVASADFYSKMIETGTQALQGVLTESAEIFDGEITDETFESFYQLLLKTGEQHYQELFTSKMYLSSLETFVETGLDFYDSWNGLLEEALRYTPIVTKSETDEIHKEVYNLKKRLAALEKQMRSSDKNR